MQKYANQLPEAVRLKALALGKVGTEWIARLDQQVDALKHQWHITMGKVLEGGSASLVLQATQQDGQPAILKISLPDTATDLLHQAKVLQLANGRGYAKLLAHDHDLNAILVEKLGSSLAQQNLPIIEQIKIICATLNTAWQPLSLQNNLMNGAEKAKSLADFISQLWHELDEPCTQATIHMALSFAEERADAFTPTNCVLGHGDAHAHNTLQDLHDKSAYRFIDPDGLFIEPAYDLAIPMREWGAELLAGDALRLGKERCNLLSSLTNVDPHAIWQWGFIERVSTGLFLHQIGMRQVGAEFLAVADIWERG